MQTARQWWLTARKGRRLAAANFAVYLVGLFKLVGTRLILQPCVIGL